MHIHSAVGRKFGLKSKEIDNLLMLDPDKFDYREWLALKYAQDWTFLKGEEPTGSYVEDFYKEYSPHERAFIHKLLRMIQFANYWNNTISRKPISISMEGLRLGNP